MRHRILFWKKISLFLPKKYIRSPILITTRTLVLPDTLSTQPIYIYKCTIVSHQTLAKPNTNPYQGTGMAFESCRHYVCQSSSDLYQCHPRVYPRDSTTTYPFSRCPNIDKCRLLFTQDLSLHFQGFPCGPHMGPHNIKNSPPDDSTGFISNGIPNGIFNVPTLHSLLNFFLELSELTPWHPFFPWLMWHIFYIYNFTSGISNSFQSVYDTSLCRCYSIMSCMWYCDMLVVVRQRCEW